MPHDSNGKIFVQGDYGVSTDDVASVLGVTSSDIGTLCASENINMWAKWKPISYNSKSVLTIANRKSATWGLNMVQRSRLGSPFVTNDGLFSLLYGGNGTWTYNKPTGGAGSPYRLSDFVKISDTGAVVKNIGYKHDCVCFIEGIQDASVILDSNGDFSIGFDLAVPSEDDYNLSLADFLFGETEAKDMYLGLLLVKDNSYVFNTSASKIGTDGLTVNFSNFVLPINSSGEVWKMCPFLSSVNYSEEYVEGIQEKSGVYVSLNTDRMYNLNIQPSGSQYQVSYYVEFSAGGVGIDYSITIENKTSGTVSGTITLYVTTTTGSVLPNDSAQAEQFVIGEVTIERGQSQTLTGRCGYEGANKIEYSTSASHWAKIQANVESVIRFPDAWELVTYDDPGSDEEDAPEN